VKCPFCGHNDSRVIDSRETVTNNGASVRRRRECTSCHKRYTTYERIERVGLSIVKKSGKREDFDPEKLRRSVAIACNKLTIHTDILDQLVRDVESSLFQRGVSEVESRVIGDLVMDQLRALNPIAYIRFASVYLSFTTLQQMQEAMERLNRE